MLAKTSTRRPVAFLALTAGLTVPFWVLGALARTPDDSPVRLPASALAFVCPAVAASMLVARREGIRGVARFLRDSARVRGVKPRWWVPVVGLPPLAYGVAYGAMVLAGQPRSAPSMTPADLGTLAAIFLVTGFAEEAGWTGYATDPLRDRWGALPAALIIGTVWGLVHVVPDLQGGEAPSWIAWQRLVGSVSLRILIVWLYANTGSVGAAVLFHALDNLCWQAMLTTGPYDPAFVAPVFAIAALIVTWLWGPRTLSAFRFGGAPGVKSRQHS